MAKANIFNLGGKVTTRTTSWLSMAEKAWGSEFNAPDHDVYQFQNRRYDSTDQTAAGLYNGGIQAHNYLMIGNMQHSDTAPISHLLQENGDRLILENV